MPTINKLFGVADPQYDALRVQSNQAIWPDAGGSPVGGAGGLENKIYLWHTDGSTIDLFDPDETGLGLALAAAVSGDTVWLPSIPIALTAAVTVPAGVMLRGIDQSAIISRTANSAADLVTVQGPSSGIAYLSHLTINCTQNGTGTAIAVQGAAGQLYIHDCTLAGDALAGGYAVASGDGVITIDDTWLVGSTASILGGATDYTPGSIISSGAISITSESGDTIGSLSIGAWYCVEAYDAYNRWTGGPDPYPYTNEIQLSNDGGSTWEGKFGGRGFLSAAADVGPATVYNTDLPSFCPFGEFWGSPDATRPRLYFQATATNVKIRVWDVPTAFGDNTGSLTWRLRNATAPGGSGVNVITHAVRMSPVVGQPAEGDRGVWNVENYPTRHANDIALSHFIYHTDPNNPPLHAGDIATEQLTTYQQTLSSVDGRLAVLTQVATYLSDQAQSIIAAYINVVNQGSASSTIIDVNRGGVTMFTTQANRPTLAYNSTSGWAKGAPDLTQLSEGSIVSFDIDQVATGAEILIISLLLGAAAIVLNESNLNSGKLGSTTDNIVLALGGGGDWDDQHIEGPGVVARDGTVYLYYDAGATRKIGVATAPVNGFTGTNFTKYGSNPILSNGAGGAWDEIGVLEPWVLYDADAALWKMWYAGINAGGAWAIGYATATNPLGPWTKYSGNPVLPATVAWEVNRVIQPNVWKEGGLWRMIYSGADPAGPGRIGYATSTDGIAWSKYPSNPVLSNSGADWMAASVFSMRTIVKQADGYHAYFCGKQTTSGYSKIGWAHSTDLITWTFDDTSAGAILYPTRAWEGTESEDPVMIVVGDYRYVFYDNFFGSPATIGVTRSPLN